MQNQLKKGTTSPKVISNSLMQSLTGRFRLNEIDRARWQGLIESKSFKLVSAEKSMRVGSQYLQKLEVSEIESILNERGELVTLSTLEKYRGRPVAMAAITSIVAPLSKFFNVGKGMNTEMIQMVAEVFLDSDEFNKLTLPDLKLAYEWAKQGKYTVYDRVDGGVLVDWVRAYLDKRIAKSEARNASKHFELKEDLKSQKKPIPESVRKMFAEREKKLKLEKPRKSSIRHQSIENWCIANDRDPEAYINEKLKGFYEDFKALKNETMSWDHYKTFRMNKHLLELNDKRE